MPKHLFGWFGEVDAQFADASVMLQRIWAFDWSGSSAGPLKTWPDELKSALRLVLNSPSGMAVLVGRDGIVVHNEALREMLGNRYDGVLGKPVAKALPIAANFFSDVISSCYNGTGVRVQDQPIRLKRNSTLETAWFSLGFTPIADTSANIHGVLVVVSETTERMRTLRALERARQRMNLALEAGGIIGTWDLDVRNNKVTTNGTFAALFGVSEKDAHDGVSNDILSASVHPEDRDRVLETLRAAIRSGSDYRCSYRAVTSGGEVRWFVVSGRPVHDAKGRVVQFAGIVIDITAQTETTAALEQSNLRFDILAESIPQIIWSTDAEGRHDYFNQRWTEFTGITAEEIEPTTWQELVHPEDWPRVAETWSECLATGNTYDIDYRFRHKDGDYRWLWVLALPLRDANRRIVRWYGTSSDIDAPKRLEEQRELVSHELDHRIKNLFALVNGLVSLSVREQPEHKPLADSLRARLNALNQAHGVIRGAPNAKSGSMRSLLQQLLEPYTDGNSDRITIEGADVALDAGTVTAFALVFHELITNATKYGALSRPDGSLLISLRLEADRQIIDWQECFEGNVNGGSTEGFGSRLLKTMVEGQLRGTITRDLSTTGLTTRIDIPHSALFAHANSTAR
ncbi:MAG TPA: PAS domain-containing protein [Afipia sp.]